MFALSIETDNAAFGVTGAGAMNLEVARILRELAEVIAEAPVLTMEQGALHDYNGNSVGHWSFRAGLITPARWTIAVDDDPTNPNPHHLTVRPERFETEAEAIKLGEELDEDEQDDDYRACWSVVYV